MGQLSSGTVQLATFQDMIKRFNNYVTKNGSKPGKIFTVNGGTDYVTLSVYGVMASNYTQYQKVYNKKPNNIEITLTKKSYQPTPVNPSKPKTQLQWESALGKTFTTIKQAYNLIIGTGYGHYNDDVLSYEEVLASLKGTLPKKPNCTDICQAFKKLADAMKYETRYIHKICQSGEGHITLEIRGKELGNSWIEIGPAEAISVGSQYSWGKVWCPNPRSRWISDEAWLTGPDDGNMG